MNHSLCADPVKESLLISLFQNQSTLFEIFSPANSHISVECKPSACPVLKSNTGDFCVSGTIPILLKLKDLLSTKNESPSAQGSFYYAIVAEHVAGKINKPHLFGKEDADCVELFQWIKFATEALNEALTSFSAASFTDPLKMLNDALQTRTFLLGDYFSLADYFVFGQIKSAISKGLISEKTLSGAVNVFRWVNFIHYFVDKSQDGPLVKQMQSVSMAATSAADAVAKKTASANENSRKAAAAPKKPVEEDARLPICHVDIRVGHIVSCERHPEAEALYVEKVDFGEGRQRTILSGLVRHLPAEALRDKLALFVCNLKPANLRGICSEGMILAATSTGDAPTVELLVPPAGSIAGDRVIVEGVDAALFVPDDVLNPKKKIIEAVKEDLKTTADCIAAYKNMPLIIAGKGRITVPSNAEAPIS